MARSSSPADERDAGGGAHLTRSAGDPSRVVVLATCTAALGTLPVWLLGALAVQMRDDLGFSEVQLGLASGAFMTVAAATSIPAGLWVKRHGWAPGTAVVAAVVGLAAAGIALAVRSWTGLVVLLCLAGLANAVAQPTSNLALVEGVPRARQGIGFGIKQGSVPAGTLLAGLAVPLVAIPFGWRWAFVGVAVASVLLGITARRAAAQRRSPQRPVRSGATSRIPRRDRLPLVVLAVAAGLGTAASNALGTFLVVYAVTTGVSPARAGALLVVGSVANLVTRLVLGLWADARGGSQLPLVSAMMVAGSAGLALLSVGPNGSVLVASALLAFTAGWGWNGLFHLSVMQAYHQHAAAATGVVSTFLYVGGAVGPAAFGLLAVHSYASAWLAMSGACLAGAGLVCVGSALLRSLEPPAT